VKIELAYYEFTSNPNRTVCFRRKLVAANNMRKAKTMGEWPQTGKLGL
jgi:hypothetical protein